MLVHHYFGGISKGQSAVIVNLLLFGSVVYFLSQIGSVTCSKNQPPQSYRLIRRAGRRNINANTNSTYRQKIGGHSADLMIAIMENEEKEMIKRRKDQKKKKDNKKYSGLTGYSGNGNAYKDDFDDSTGFYSDDHIGGGGHGTSSHQYHYSSYLPSHNPHEIQGPTNPYAAETSYSLISFITFANFLLFVLYPLLTLPKRNRIAHEEALHLYHTSPVHIHTPPGGGGPPIHGHGGGGPPIHGHGGGGPPIHGHGGGGPPIHGHGGGGPLIYGHGRGGPPIHGHGGGGPHGGGGFMESHGYHQFGPDGSHGGSHSGSHVYDTDAVGWSPHYGGHDYHSSTGYNPGPDYGGHGSPADMATSFGPVNPMDMNPKPHSHKSSKTKSKSSKKKKMKNAGSEHSPVYDHTPLPLIDLETYNNNEAEGAADGSILSKDEILQILQDLDKPDSPDTSDT